MLALCVEGIKLEAHAPPLLARPRSSSPVLTIHTNHTSIRNEVGGAELVRSGLM